MSTLVRSYPRLAISLASFASCLLGILPVTPVSAEGDPSPSNGFMANRFMGVASCSSSNCHGAIRARPNSKILHNEFTVWHTHDNHSKAWTALLKDDAKKIGEHLGISAPEKEPWCLRCHATYVPELAHQGEKYTIEDGVGCESCHGAAEGWLQSHTKSGATHEENVARGLKSLENLHARSMLCLSCHFGDEEKQVNHRLIGAGHPRLTFELDTFSMIQPRHWEVDEDYKERKSEYIPAKAWIVGQITLASEQITQLLSERRSKNGRWPELTLFTCESCHHTLKEDRWKKREFHGRAGELRLNLSSLIITLEVVRGFDPEIAQEIHSLATNLHEKYRDGEGEEDARKLSRLLKEKVLPFFETSPYSDETINKMLHTLISFAVRPHFQYEEAEQILMGISSLLASSPALEERYRTQKDALFQALRDDEAFIAEEFTEAALKFQKGLTR